MSRDRVRLSRTVAHAVRHKPSEYGLEPDDEGWVPVVDLLAGLRRHRREWRNLGEADLAEMIARSDKRRYEMRDGKIRALYGHSLPGKLARETAEPPATLYHGTVSQALRTIRLEGLRPMRRQYVHLSHDTQTAREVGARRQGQTIVLAVRAAEAYRQGIKFYRGNDKVWLADRIPPEFIAIPEGS